MDYSSAYPWAKKVFLKETSIYNSRLRIRELRELGALSKKDENLVKVVACREGEPICSDESLDLNRLFCFFYATFFTKVLLCLPLSIFEKELLTKLNVAPAQLHPNSWAFIWGFIILCSQLSILPTVEVFFYFFELKHSGRQLWASLNGSPGRGLLTLFQSSYKKFKGRSIKVCASAENPSLLDGFLCIGRPIPDSRVLGVWKTCPQGNEVSTNFLRTSKSSSTCQHFWQRVPPGRSQGLHLYTPLKPYLLEEPLTHKFWNYFVYFAENMLSNISKAELAKCAKKIREVAHKDTLQKKKISTGVVRVQSE